ASSVCGLPRVLPFAIDFSMPRHQARPMTRSRSLLWLSLLASVPFGCGKDERIADEEHVGSTGGSNSPEPATGGAADGDTGGTESATGGAPTPQTTGGASGGAVHTGGVSHSGG